MASGGGGARIAEIEPQSEAQPHYPRKRSLKRACEECKRKKTKCDMRRPMCSLCERLDSDCIFPTKRKRHQSKSERRSPTSEVQMLGNEEISRLISLIESGVFRQDMAAMRKDDSRELHLEYLPTDVFEQSPQSTSPRTSTDDNAFLNGVTDSAFRSPMDQQSLVSPQESDHLLAPLPAEFWDMDEGYSFLDPAIILDLPDDGLMSFPSSDNVTHPKTLEMLRFDTTTPVGEEHIKTYNLSISASIADHLIETFFSKVHHCLPIFHRAKFYGRYINNQQPNDERYNSLSLESALILYSMFALSARFSISDVFEGIPIKERGKLFASEAQLIYQEATQAVAPSLELLHGCVLLAYYQQASGPSSRAWIMTGFCTRLAYELCLNLVDEDLLQNTSIEDPQWFSVQDWVRREEFRRAWWSVWELDTFISILSCRPFTIDRHRMHVLLPVSDFNWFSESPIRSNFLATNPLSTWKCLRGSHNQDERAWFLVSNFLMQLSHELAQKNTISLQDKRDMETALSCFALVLPRQFNLSARPLVFDEDNFKKSNWVISTILMIQGAWCFTALLREERTPGTNISKTISADGTSELGLHLITNTGTNSSLVGVPFQDIEICLDQCRPYINQSLRALRVWSPDYIPLSGPFIACAMIGPAALNIAVSQEGISRQSVVANGEMIELVLNRFAEYWELASLLLELAKSVNPLDYSSDSTLTLTSKEISVRFAMLLPNIRSRIRTTCSETK